MLAWSELLVKGSTSGDSNWSTIATLTQGSDANSWSGTINASSWTSGATLSFKLNDTKDDGGKWWGNGSATADMTSASTATITTSTVNGTGDNMSLKHNTAYSSYTISCTYSNNSWTITITGVQSSSGDGSTTTTTNTAGIYIYGANFGTTDPTQKMTYKFLRKNDTEYHFSIYAGNMSYNVYDNNLGNDTEITPSNNNSTFKIAYVDESGNTTTFCPSSNYSLTSSDASTSTAATAQSFGSTTSTQWTVTDNGGMYDLVVIVDADGKPTKWYYESDANRIVAYKASSTSNWTTEAFLYCVKDASTASTGYCNNFFGTMPMVQDEEFKFILCNRWFGMHNNRTDEYTKDIAINATDNIKSNNDGNFPVEFNCTRDNYIINGGDQTPTRIFMIGSALNTSLGDTFSEYDPADATELVYDKEEGCYKGTVKLTKGKVFRFLRDKNSSGAATSLELNSGEDSNVPGASGATDTDDNNHVAYNTTSTSGTNVTFNPETNVYNVRFYIEANTAMSSFSWTAAKYRYTIELPSRLSIILNPTSATVPYGTTLTPKATVNVPSTETSTERRYAFTIDGTTPTIDASTGKASGTSTYVVDYTYDAVVPTSDVATFKMNGKDVLEYILNDKTTGTLSGSTVTVTAQAIQKVSDTKYRLEGNVATGTYTFKTAGIVNPETNKYTITVTNNDGTATSVNKVTATVVVYKNGTVDATAPAYYTIDGTNPATSNTRSLVRNRTITLYTLPKGVTTTNTIKVCVAGAAEDENKSTHASCTYDLTYSTSEGGYLNYLNNDQNAKTLGGSKDVIIYVQPYTSDATNYPLTSYSTYVNAYENVTTDGTTTANELTPSPGRVLTDDDKVTVNSETWYALDAQPTEGFDEINISLGRKATDGTEYTTPVTVANVNKDIFLKYDVATGKITDVTHANTKDYFYTVGTKGATGVTKTEVANPNPQSSTAKEQHFIYVQVPAAWVTNGNTLKVLNGTAVAAEGTNVEVQPAAETSAMSYVCKVYGLSSITDGTSLTFQPYNGTTASSLFFSAPYKDGGYYYYESAMQTSNVPYLIFSPTNETTDGDHRSYGHHDINHVTTGDKTNYLNKTWDNASTTTSDDNWTGSKGDVYKIASGTTISQTVSGLDKDATYTVQMIVRGKKSGTENVNATMTLAGTENKTVTGSFDSYTSNGTISENGRVDALYTDLANGWRKLETAAKPNTNGELTISLTADANGELELSDVTLLENANTKGHVWTKAPTNSSKTEFDLSRRSTANGYSFFDRGTNHNAIVYVDANTVVGRDAAALDIAAATTSSGTTTYSMAKLALTDTDGKSDWTNDNAFQITKDNITANSFSYDRSFMSNASSEGSRSTFVFPFAMSSDMITSLFGENAEIDSITGMTESSTGIGTVTGSKVTKTYANVPYLLKLSAAKDGISTTLPITLEKNSKEVTLKVGDTDDVFVGVYQYTNITTADDTENHYRYYAYNAAYNGSFNWFSEHGADSKPFRAYLKHKYSTGSPAKKYYLFRIVSPATDIKPVSTETYLSDNTPVYNIQGMYVGKGSDVKSLPSGIYIQNGHKFVKK